MKTFISYLLAIAFCAQLDHTLGLGLSDLLPDISITFENSAQKDRADETEKEKEEKVSHHFSLNTISPRLQGSGNPKYAEYQISCRKLIWLDQETPPPRSRSQS